VIVLDGVANRVVVDPTENSDLPLNIRRSFAQCTLIFFPTARSRNSDRFAPTCPARARGIIVSCPHSSFFFTTRSGASVVGLTHARGLCRGEKGIASLVRFFDLHTRHVPHALGALSTPATLAPTTCLRSFHTKRRRGWSSKA